MAIRRNPPITVRDPSSFLGFRGGYRKYVGLGKTTAELEAGGNYGQGRMAYETRVNQRKQNVALRRRAKYMDRARRMGRQPRAYRSDRLGGLNSAIGRKYGFELDEARRLPSWKRQAIGRKYGLG